MRAARTATRSGFFSRGDFVEASAWLGRRATRLFLAGVAAHDGDPPGFIRTAALAAQRLADTTRQAVNNADFAVAYRDCYGAFWKISPAFDRLDVSAQVRLGGAAGFAQCAVRFGVFGTDYHPDGLIEEGATPSDDEFNQSRAAAVAACVIGPRAGGRCRADEMRAAAGRTCLTLTGLASTAYEVPALLVCPACQGNPNRRDPCEVCRGNARRSLHLDPDRLAVLADAMEERGWDESLTAHLRGPGYHVKGCHVLDIAMGRR